MKDEVKSLEKINRDLNHELDEVSNNIIKSTSTIYDEYDKNTETAEENTSICSYFKMGKCKVINCKYKHQEENTSRNDKQHNLPIQPCVFYRMGNCKTMNCEFRHEKSKTYSNTNTNDKTQEDQNGDQVSIQSKIQCKYYKQGNCRLGNRCPYNHSYDSLKEGKAKTPCTYFLQGNCKWGQNCHFSHQREVRSTARKSYNKENCPEHLRGKCNKGFFCTKAHPDKSNRCQDFDKGYCKLGSRCRKTHMPDRPVLRLPNHDQSLELSHHRTHMSQRIAKQNTTQSETPIAREKASIEQRCKDFDNGHCPNRHNCKLKHAKDRDTTTRNPNLTKSVITVPNDRTNRNLRCKEFDNGFCPNKGNCTKKHARDRNISMQNEGHKKRIQNISATNPQL